MVFVPEPSGTLSAMCTGQLSNFVCYLRRNRPELHGPSAPGPSELDQPSGTLQHLISHLRRNRPEPHQLFARNRLRRNPSEHFGTLSAICARTLWNFISFPPRNPGTSSAICTGTLRKLVCCYLHRNPPELHQPAAPELSGTSPAICTGTLRNLISNLRRKAPEPSRTLSGTWCCSCTGSRQSFSGLKTP